MKNAIIAAIALGLAALPWLSAQAAAPKTKRVSVRSNGAEAEGHSYSPSLSANGRFVAFESTAGNLVPQDDNTFSDVFVHNRKTSRTKRVSVRSNGDEADGPSYGAAISADKRLVAFTSDATNLVPGDENDFLDIFVHNRETGRTKRVSVRSNGDEAEEGDSETPVLSANGRFVAFSSEATNLVPGDDNEEYDVFVHDRKTGKTKRVSLRSNGNEAEDSGSFYPSISANGRFVAFESEATNLVPGDENDSSDIFVHNRNTKRTKRVSVRSNGTEADAFSADPSISATGRFVAFSSGASNLVGSDTNSVGDVFVHDLDTKRTKRVSVRSNGAEGDEYSDDPSISANGRFVAFKSEAPNFVAGDTSDGDIFVHNRRNQRTKRVSVRSNGDESGPGDSFNPSVSADGRFVAFDSDVENFVPGDGNSHRDIFVRGPLR